MKLEEEVELYTNDVDDIIKTDLNDILILQKNYKKKSFEKALRKMGENLVKQTENVKVEYFRRRINEGKSLITIIKNSELSEETKEKLMERIKTAMEVYLAAGNYVYGKEKGWY